MKNKKHLFFLILIAAALAGAAFYFFYFIRTPSYALTEALSALRSHDVKKFERYVDINSVMDNAFEDIIVAESKINNDTIFSNPFALGILHMLKPSVVGLLVQETRERVANLPESDERPADPVPDAMRRNMERHIPLKKLTVKDVKITKVNAQEAIAAIALHNEALNKDFIAELSMETNEHEDWQIKKVSNFTDLVIQFDAAKKAQQAANNKPVLERLRKAAAVGEARLSMFRDSNTKALEPQTKLTVLVSVKNTSSVTINRMYYDVIILDANDEDLYSYPGHFQGSIAPGQSTELNASKILNKLLPDDKRLMELDASKEKCRIQITYIAFDDGNVLAPNTFIE